VLSAQRSTSLELGAFAGFTMTARIDRVSVRGPEFSVGLRGRRSYSRGEYFPLTADIDPISPQLGAELLETALGLGEAILSGKWRRRGQALQPGQVRLELGQFLSGRVGHLRDLLEEAGEALHQAEETRRQAAASQREAPAPVPALQTGDGADRIAQDQPGQAQGGVRFSLTAAGATTGEPRSAAAIWEALRETAEAILPPEITVRVVEAIDDAVDGGARLSLAGRRAGTARLDTLASAERLEASGRPPQAIFAATGWLRGPDGKWRWEIDDSGAQLLNVGKYTRTPSRSLTQRLLRRQPVRTGDWHSVNNIPLPRILHHPPLFAAYPFLRQMRVDLTYVKGLPDTLTSGALQFRQTAHATIYRPIRVLAGSEAQILDVLLHEIQHYIQRREGFAQWSDLPRRQRGAGGGSGRPPLYDPTLGAWENAAFPASASVVTDTALEMDAETLLRAYRLADSADPGIASGARAEIAELEARIERDMRVRAGDYGRSFGEWEAGLVALRRRMTAGERRAAFPLAGMPKGLHVSRWQTRDYQAAFDELMRRAMINLAVRERWAECQDIGAGVGVVRSDEHWLIYAQGREPKAVFAEVHDAYRDAASATIALASSFAALGYPEQCAVMDAIRADLRRRNMNPQPLLPLDENLFAFWARYDPAEVADDPRLHREALTQRLKSEYGEAAELVLSGDMANWDEAAQMGVTDPYAVYVKLPPSPNILPDAERARIETRVAQLEAEHIALHAERPPTVEAARQRLRRLEQIWQERLGQEQVLKVDDELRRGVYRVPDEVIAGLIPEIQRDIDDTGGVDFDLWLTAQRDRAMAERGIMGDARLALQVEGDPIGRFDPDRLLIEITRHALDPEAVLRHEAIHALRAIGLFTPAEWATLEQAARKQGWILTSGTRALYAARHADLAPPALEKLLVEEAIAERFSAWRKGTGVAEGAIARLFERIQQFLERLGNALRRCGFISVEDIFDAIASGAVAARSPAAREQSADMIVKSADPAGGTPPEASAPILASSRYALRPARWQDYAERITAQAVRQMREGDAPWLVSQPAGTRFLPFNPVTGRDYSGINALVLLMVARDRGYADPRWVTRDQAHAIGAAVRAGEASTVLQYWRWSEDRLVPGPDGRPLLQRVALTRPRLQAATVFNAGQVDGLPLLAPRPVMTAAERHAAAEAIIAASSIRREHLPDRQQFDDVDNYYVAAFHALVRHEWHNIATNAQYMHPLGSKEHTRGELIASIATFLFVADLNIGYNSGSINLYIPPVIEVLQSDASEIFKITRDAEAVMNALRGRAPEPQQADQVVNKAGPADTARRSYLAVPYAERQDARRLGARWDKAARCWYVPAGTDLTRFDRWRPVNVAAMPGDPHREFAEALRLAGLLIDGLPIMDGALRRVPVIGDKKGERSGAYNGHLDARPAGFIQNFKQGTKANWTSQTPRAALDAAERARLLNQMAQSRAAREAERMALAEETAKLVRAHLDAMPRIEETPAASAVHTYLRGKGVRAHGVFLNTTGPLAILAGAQGPQYWSAKGHLLVPVRDVDGLTISAQSIAPDGRKSFPRGAVLAGGHHLIGAIDPARPLLIAEGYATGATLHEATGLPVAIAFHAGNLLAVATAYRKRFPDLPIIVAGDNDHHLMRQTGADGKPRPNVGKVSAELAATAARGVVMIPSFAPSDPGTDWNDGARALGDAFQADLRAALAVAERRLNARTIDKPSIIGRPRSPAARRA
jgi:phage/plasmid primase-like uncharacterized protein/antirestriction protein ArdC